MGGDIGQIIVLANSAARMIAMRDVVALVSETGRSPPCHQVASLNSRRLSPFEADPRFYRCRMMGAWAFAALA
jgi:hypothetical protein